MSVKRPLFGIYSILVNPFSPTLFLIVAKRVYQSVQRHTVITHPFNVLTFGHHGAPSWASKCPNVKKLKMLG